MDALKAAIHSVSTERVNKRGQTCENFPKRVQTNLRDLQNIQLIESWVFFERHRKKKSG